MHEKEQYKYDLHGQRFGRLVVIRYIGEPAASWACRCDCGEDLVVRSGALRRGATLSCGCLYRESRTRTRRTHGMSRTATYTIWKGIVARTTNPHQSTRPYYMDRGIEMCARWRASFEAFLEDMGERPSRDLSIDRVDNDRGYDCGKCEDCVARKATPNCRWATRREQALNTRRTVMLTFQGKTMPQDEWDASLGLSRGTICKRLRRGWSIEKALSTQRRDLYGVQGK